MSETTTFGVATQRNPIMSDERRDKLIDDLSRDDSHKFSVDRNSPTWKAIMQEIGRLRDTDYQLTLRKKSMDHGETQYARGALDALDCLLVFGGEEV